MIADCFKHSQIFKSIQHQQVPFMHANKSLWICWMLSVLQELTQLLLLYYITYCSLDLKMTLTHSAQLGSNSDCLACKECGSVVVKKCLSKLYTLPCISEHRCLNYIPWTDFHTENKINFLSPCFWNTSITPAWLLQVIKQTLALLSVLLDTKTLGSGHDWMTEENMPQLKSHIFCF